MRNQILILLSLTCAVHMTFAQAPKPPGPAPSQPTQQSQLLPTKGKVGQSTGQVPSEASPTMSISPELLQQQVPQNSIGPAELGGSQALNGLSARDPFKLPEQLIILLRQRLAITNSGGVDPTVEAVRRFPLASYQLVGIIWDVKKPKAMFLDRLNSIHMLQVNDFIGNAKGVIVSIQSGSVTILEGKIPQIIKLKK